MSSTNTVILANKSWLNLGGWFVIWWGGEGGGEGPGGGGLEGAGVGGVGEGEGPGGGGGGDVTTSGITSI